MELKQLIKRLSVKQVIGDCAVDIKVPMKRNVRSFTLNSLSLPKSICPYSERRTTYILPLSQRALPS